MASQKRGGSNQKIAPPIVEDGTVRRVLQNTENLFNQELVDRVFEDLSISSRKLDTGTLYLANLSVNFPNTLSVSELFNNTGGTFSWLRIDDGGTITYQLTTTPNVDSSKVHFSISPAQTVGGTVVFSMSYELASGAGVFLFSPYILDSSVNTITVNDDPISHSQPIGLQIRIVP